MGRIKTSFIKHIGRELYEKHSGKFTADYAANKKIIDNLIYMKSKKLKNILTGYITTLKKRAT